MLGEYGSSVGMLLALGDAAHPGSLKSEVEAADPCEQREVIERRDIHAAQPIWLKWSTSERREWRAGSIPAVSISSSQCGKS